MNVLRAVLPQLRAQRSGHIVQMSSLEGVAPLAAGETAYAATKFAAEGIGEALSRELRTLGIGVTIVEPGPVRTDFGEHAAVTPVRTADYTDSVAHDLAWFADLAGRQPNDPLRVSRAIVEAVTSDDPPLRLALGNEAVEAIRAKLELQLHELERWAPLASATAFPTS
jgi:short-subunit dehydrogenase